jgi:hypothetical protein
MELLTRHAGTWTGTNRFRLMPDDPPAEGAATAEVSLGAGGNVAVLAYTWTHPDDGVQDGLLVLGPDESPGAVLALWGDSWHQKPAAKQLAGTADRDSLTVSYSYAEEWEWRIALSLDRPDLLRWRMDNVVPPSAAGTAEAVTYWAMDGELRRLD